MKIDKIFENIKPELLTDDVKNNIKTLIEAKVSEKIDEKTEELQEKFEDYRRKEIKKLNEKAEELEDAAVTYVDEHLIDGINGYCDFLAEKWMRDNKIEIENGLKADMYDKLAENIKDVLSKNQLIEKDIEKDERVYEENKKLKEQINEQMKLNMRLKNKQKAQEVIDAFDEVCGNELTESQFNEITKLCGDFDADDINEFKDKVKYIKEKIIINSSEDHEEEENSNTLNEDYDNEIDDYDEYIQESEITKKEEKDPSDLEGIEYGKEYF